MPIAPYVPTASERLCPRCLATLKPGQPVCWLCLRRVDADGGSAAGVGAAPVEPVEGFSLASLMMFVTLVSVVLGVSTLAPGVGIPLGIILLVVWLRTAARARRRRELGIAVSWAEKVQLFFASFSVTIMMLALVGAAGIAAFAAACFMCAGAFGETQVAGIAILVGLAAVAICFGLWGAAKGIRNRWLGDADL